MFEGLARSSFPRSSAYDAVWLMTNMMGPCSVWLTEALADDLSLSPGLHVVDLGCGKAMSSIFLAREFGVDVTAVDLWVAAHDNEKRVAAAGLAEQVRPLHADGMTLDLSEERVDALISIDAFHYFADNHGSVRALARQVRPGGQIGVVVPGLRSDGGWPSHLADHWQDSFSTFKSAGWWKTLWDQETTVHVDRARVLDWGGSEDWISWADACDEWAILNDREPYLLEGRMLRDDAAGSLVFIALTATKL